MNLIRVFFNPLYTPYDSPAYIVYIPGVSTYMVTTQDSFILLDSTHLTNDNIDTFCASRMFNPIVDVDPKTNESFWHDPYGDSKSRSYLNKAMTDAKSVVAQRYKFNLIRSTNLKTTFGAMSILTKI